MKGAHIQHLRHDFVEFCLRMDISICHDLGQPGNLDSFGTFRISSLPISPTWDYIYQPQTTLLMTRFATSRSRRFDHDIVECGVRPPSSLFHIISSILFCSVDPFCCARDCKHIDTHDMLSAAQDEERSGTNIRMYLSGHLLSDRH